LIEWKRNRFVTVQQNLSLGKPIGLEQSPVEFVKHLVQRRAVENGIAITPDRDGATWDQHPLRFIEERARLEPVERPGGGHEVD